MKNLLFLMMLCVSVTPLHFTFQIQHDMISTKGGKLRKDGKPITNAATNLMRSHTA